MCFSAEAEGKSKGSFQLSVSISQDSAPYHVKQSKHRPIRVSSSPFISPHHLVGLNLSFLTTCKAKCVEAFDLVIPCNSEFHIYGGTRVNIFTSIFKYSASHFCCFSNKRTGSTSPDTIHHLYSNLPNINFKLPHTASGISPLPRHWAEAGKQSLAINPAKSFYWVEQQPL